MRRRPEAGAGPAGAPAQEPGAALDACFRDEWPRLVAAAARVTGDVGAAEEIVQEVLVTALARWPFAGVPERPGAWLMTAVRNRARNHVRDKSRERARQEALTPLASEGEAGRAHEAIADDRLRLIFVSCHPLLAPEAQVALTLRLIGGLSTRQIARAFLQPEATVAQRLVRAKRMLAEAPVPFAAPSRDEWPQRLPAVLGTVYLIFNEGYAASDGASLTREDLCAEALRLGRLLAELLPSEGEVHGLVALMELHAARLPARVGGDGGMVLLADQDRSRWDATRIAAGLAALDRARSCGAPGPLTLQAELAACHATAPSWDATDWGRIVELYDGLAARAASPVVALNRAVAIAMRHGPEEGLRELDQLVEAGDLDSYHLLWAARADLWRRSGRPADAADAYRHALTLASNPVERRYLAGRLAECETTTDQKGAQTWPNSSSPTAVAGWGTRPTSSKSKWRHG
jgi:RNA polymerase sigma factor (sigma-70 family)